jgi:hypothetical protein
MTHSQPASNEARLSHIKQAVPARTAQFSVLQLRRARGQNNRPRSLILGGEKWVPVDETSARLVVWTGRVCCRLRRLRRRERAERMVAQSECVKRSRSARLASCPPCFRRMSALLAPRRHALHSLRAAMRKRHQSRHRALALPPRRPSMGWPAHLISCLQKAHRKPIEQPKLPAELCHGERGLRAVGLAHLPVYLACA